MKTDAINSDSSSKNQVSFERLSIKYRMNLIDSFDDLLNLIKKMVPQKHNSDLFKINRVK